MAAGGGGGRDPVVVGPYRLITRLGEGGMGVVHLAVDRDGRAVAIKLLRPQVAADPYARLRLRREVETLRRVRHPRVAGVLDADVDGDPPYLVTQFVPGRPLEQVVREDGPLPPADVARLGAALAEALEAIHAVGVVHRDVKPANVMLVDGQPVLIDFGIAHVAEDSRITVTGLVMGTPGYLSPEVTNGESVVPSTDWWGWGATLAYACTGRNPFGTGPIEVVLDRVRRGQADLHGIADPLYPALASALETDPRRRPSGRQLVTMLSRPARAARPSAPTVAVPPPPATIPAPVGAGGNWFAWARSATQVVPAPPPQYAGFGPPPAVPAYGPHSGGRPLAAAPAQAAPGSTTPGWSANGSSGAPGWTGSGSTPRAAAAPGTAGGAMAPPPGAGSLLSTAPPPGSASPGPQRAARNAVLVAGWASLVALAAVAPVLSSIVAVTGFVAARTVERSRISLWRRRSRIGRRGSDVPVTLLALPWRLATSALMTVPALLLPICAGVVAMFAVAVVPRGTGVQLGPEHPLALAAGMGSALLVAWWGLGGSSVRGGTRAMVRAVTPGAWGSQVTAGLLVLLVLACLLVANAGTLDWVPLGGPPLGL